MNKHPNIFRWHTRGLRITGKDTAVIDIFIPGVNQRDKVDVRLNLLDKILGETILSKTLRVFREWEETCKRKNAELDEAQRLTDQLGKQAAL